MERKINTFLKCFDLVVDCIADLFGPNCEVVLHDISDLEHSILKIRNGHVTGRKVGDSMTDVGLEMIKEAENGFSIIGNYNPKTKTGKILKSNAINIRDPEGKHIGILCINLDVNELIQCEQKIRNFYKVEDERKDKVSEEHFEENIWSIMHEIIDNVIEEHGISIHNLKKEDRLEIINKVDKKGLFLIKGAVLQVGKILGISSPTVYKYLEEIRFSSKEMSNIERNNQI